MPKLTEKRILPLILILFFILGACYTFMTPVFEASDELWHYPMVRHLADGNALPVQPFDPEQAGPWKQEASQPPLYYYLGALLTFWIDTSDMEEIRWLNPHVDNGIITEDGNINLVVHDPEANPWEGTLLAVRLVRLFSLVLGTLTVFLTYYIAKQVAPGRPEIALGAAAVNAFTPMFLFISGAVNNDNLVIPLASLSLLLMTFIVSANQKDSARGYVYLILLGIVIGLGTLTKITAIGLLLLAAFAVFIERWRTLGRQANLKGLMAVFAQMILHYLLILGPTALIAGWWYYRNITLYGDWSGWNAFIAVLGERATPAGLAQLWDERWGFMISYWGLFGGLNVPMPTWIYRVLNGTILIACIGFLYYLVATVKRWFGKSGQRIKTIGRLIWNLLKFSEDHIALILCLLWSSAVIVGLIRWAQVTWSSQGRLVFSSISALSVLFVVGLVGWMPRRLARSFVLILAIFLFLISALAPFLWIQPAYKPADYRPAAEIRIVNKEFGDLLRLNGYSLDKTSVSPGQTVEVQLNWETISATPDDWSVFVHLTDPILETPIAQRDMYPGQGLLATSLLQPGDRFVDSYLINIPDATPAPAELTLSVGLYDFFTGERLLLPGGSDVLVLTEVYLEPVPGELPNPVSVNFENVLTLSGFALDSQRIESGGTIMVTLYWLPEMSMAEDYTFFAQLVDQDTTRWASRDIQLKTSDWQKGELQKVELILPVAAETPAAVYPLIIGIYSRASDGDFDRLQVVTDQGRLTDDFLSIAKVRISSGSDN